MHPLFAQVARGITALFLLTLALALQAQTCSIPGQDGTATIAAQPNTFFAGSGSPGAGATSITVSGPGTGVNIGINPGDLLLIIQMQGADINATDTNAYGAGVSAPGVTNTVAYGATGYAGGVTGANFIAGNYEWAVATGGGATFAAGGTIQLMSGLVNSYATRTGSTAQGKQAWQVVVVPQYANLTLSGGLTVQPWNGSTGGVLVLEATGDINLAAQTILGTGRGFRGAGGFNVGANAVCTGAYNTTGCPQYVSTIASDFGASKGEGLAGTPGRIYTLDFTGGGAGTIPAAGADGYLTGEAARGAPGNAGGGGDQHNGGGGGAGNGGAGGKGGNTWNSSSTTYQGLALGGFGGSPSGNTASRWIMGGGGGAGDVGGNTSTSPDGSGGAGGALVIIRASRITGGGTITVNGVAGQQARATDAAGGGGAGGTVVVTANSLNGGLTVNALGGNGGSYTVAGAEQDGVGGGGGGGVLISNVAGITFSATGGAAGASASTACPPANAGANCGQTAGFAGPGAAGYAITSPGVQVGYECLPNLTVTKTTSTPLVTSTTGATAGYVVTITNTGGAARFVTLNDALPTGWSLFAAGAYTYFPTAAGRLPTGAETAAVATSRTWVVGATPLTNPAAAANPLIATSFAIAPIVAGVPSVVTYTFVAAIPNTASVGTYHNSAGVSFLDPTRAAASTRLVSPLTSNTANRSATSYGSTTYANFNGGTAQNVAGSNYNGLVAGPTTEDVQLIPDFSITKAAGAASAAPNATFTYTLTPRNNGRPVSTQTYTVSQATDVSLAQIPSLLGSNPLTVTDTLPSGISITTAFTGTGWTCSGTSTIVCTNTTAWPIAAGTNFPVITGVAQMQSCGSGSASRTNTAVVSTGVGETVATNNTATAATTATCTSTNITVSKTNGLASVVSGGTTAYTLTVANLGPNNAPGTVITDPAATGLSCSTVSCSVISGTATCPAAPTVANLQSPGLTIPTLNAGSTLSFVLTCSVAATGF